MSSKNPRETGTHEESESMGQGQLSPWKSESPNPHLGAPHLCLCHSATKTWGGHHTKQGPEGAWDPEPPHQLLCPPRGPELRPPGEPHSWPRPSLFREHEGAVCCPHSPASLTAQGLLLLYLTPPLTMWPSTEAEGRPAGLATCPNVLPGFV